MTLPVAACGSAPNPRRAGYFFIFLSCSIFQIFGLQIARETGRFAGFALTRDLHNQKDPRFHILARSAPLQTRSPNKKPLILDERRAIKQRAEGTHIEILLLCAYIAANGRCFGEDNTIGMELQRPFDSSRLWGKKLFC